MILDAFLSLCDSAPEAVFAVLLIASLLGMFFGGLLLWHHLSSYRAGAAPKRLRSRPSSTNRGIL